LGGHKWGNLRWPSGAELGSLRNDHNILPTLLVAMVQLFWMTTEVAAAGFSERFSQGAKIPMDGSLQSLSFSLPVDQGPMRVRVDPVDRIAVISLVALQLVNQLDQTLWSWDGNLGTLQHVSGIQKFPAGSTSMLICGNADPQFEIPLPASIFTADLGPVRLLIEIRAEEFDQGIASLNRLIIQSLDSRDQTIAHQQQQHYIIQDELLRAEAQLDLLKDLWRDERGAEGL
jgi:hypothetical protein